MKSILKRILFLSGLLLSLETTTLPAQGVSISYQVFYNELSPYGTWIDYPPYGYVWTPYAGPEFIPYGTGGHWVWTDDSWLWLSDYSWGWAPFHYGRWFYDDYYGWLWIPGNDWGPAWVCWRYSPDFYGWVALGPAIGGDFYFGYNYYGRRESWVYLPSRYITSENPSRYYGPRSGTSSFLSTSSMISRTSTPASGGAKYVNGPDRISVEKVTGSRVSPVYLRERTSPGYTLNNDHLSIYRPALSKATTDKPAPSHISNRNAIRPVSERTTSAFFKEPVPSAPAAKTPAPKQEKINSATNPAQPKAPDKSNTHPDKSYYRPEGPFDRPSPPRPEETKPAPPPRQVAPPRQSAPMMVPHNRPPSNGGHRGPG
ncbi:MAG: DUF6600 domain-containing protein [Bacteroidia bacterium]